MQKTPLENRKYPDEYSEATSEICVNLCNLWTVAAGFSAVRAVEYPFYDGNGNITDWMDADGTLAAHHEYDPYGNETTGNPPASFGFSTKPLDSTLGLYYYGYRFYRPDWGRWINRGSGLKYFANRLHRKNIGADAGISKNTGGYLYEEVGEEGESDCNPLIDGMKSGGVWCNTEKCEMEVVGCDTWPTILQGCCEAHEEKHISQCKASEVCSKSFCYKKCPWGRCQGYENRLGAGDFGEDPINGGPIQRQSEREAHAISIECMENLLKGSLTEEERQMVEQRVRCEKWLVENKYAEAPEEE